MSTQYHDYFFAFGFVNTDMPVAEQFIEYPLSLETAKTRTGITNPNVLIASPPHGWIVVYRKAPPAAPVLFKVTEVQPEYSAEHQRWLQHYSATAMTPAEIDQSVADLKVAKRAEITRSRNEANTGYFNYQGKRIACDDLSMKDLATTNSIILHLGAMPNPWPGAWKTMDNGYIPIGTVAAWHAFYAALYSQGVKNFMHSEGLKIMIDATPDIHGLRQINWNTSTGVEHS